MVTVNRISYLKLIAKVSPKRGALKYSTGIARHYCKLFFYFKAFCNYEDPLFSEIQPPVKNPYLWSVFTKKEKKPLKFYPNLGAWLGCFFVKFFENIWIYYFSLLSSDGTVKENADKMREALLMVFLDINSNRNARDFTGETVFMIFPSQFYYFMEFNNVLGSSSTDKMNGA